MAIIVSVHVLEVTIMAISIFKYVLKLYNVLWNLWIPRKSHELASHFVYNMLQNSSFANRYLNVQLYWCSYNVIECVREKSNFMRTHTHIHHAMQIATKFYIKELFIYLVMSMEVCQSKTTWWRGYVDEVWLWVWKCVQRGYVDEAWITTWIFGSSCVPSPWPMEAVES